MTATSRKTVLSRLLAASEKCLAEEARLDREIAKTIRHLVGLLVRRYQNWSGRYLSIGKKCTDYQLNADELRQLTYARVASRSEYSHKLFYSIVRDALRGEPEDCVYSIIGLFRVQDDLPSPEPIERVTTPLIDLLENMKEK